MTSQIFNMRHLDRGSLIPPKAWQMLRHRLVELTGVCLATIAVAVLAALVTYDARDPSWNIASAPVEPTNALGYTGAYFADAMLQMFGAGAFMLPAVLIGWGLRVMAHRGLGRMRLRLLFAAMAVLFAGAAFHTMPPAITSLLPLYQPGGSLGLLLLGDGGWLGGIIVDQMVLGAGCAALALVGFSIAVGLSTSDWVGGARVIAEAGRTGYDAAVAMGRSKIEAAWQAAARQAEEMSALKRREPQLDPRTADESDEVDLGVDSKRMVRTLRRFEDVVPMPSDEAAPAAAAAPVVTAAADAAPAPAAASAPAVPPTSMAAPVAPVVPPSASTFRSVVAPAPMVVSAPVSAPVSLPVSAIPITPVAAATPAAPSAPPTSAVTARSLVPVLSPVLAAPAAMVAVAPTAAPVARPADPTTITAPYEIPAPHPFRGAVTVGPMPTPVAPAKRGPVGRDAAPAQTGGDDRAYELPPLELLQPASAGGRGVGLDEASLRRNAENLESVLGDFGVRGSIQAVHPGPVVTLYELEPAPGTKSSRVIGLADDIARSMSAVSVRVAVVPGRNVIGIEMPNARREIVYLRELLASDSYERSAAKLPLVLGKDIGGTPVIADLARFPHLLVAGTTGSGKSVAVNTMILSLLYRLPPDRCRFIMIDPKMLELSTYQGIPHLLSPVVTEPKLAVVALKWTVREMENRYRAMSRLGVRNIEGYNARLKEAKEKGESLTRRVQTGFDPDTGKPLFEEQPLQLTEFPYIVVVVDEMADLMLVAGKDIEATIQRLAQMARAAGIHLIMATQRPSVDVITGTIKANFPTRISFQVTSKIDSRTILGEQGAEQLLGQGDMLYMAGGGRIQRVHGPFVRDDEVEAVVKFLKTQGEPNYIDSVTEELDEEEGGGEESAAVSAAGAEGDLYDKAVAVVCREGKASTSFIQRHLRIGYNSAARLIERMEKDGIVSKANHVGKREVLVRTAGGGNGGGGAMDGLDPEE